MLFQWEQWNCDIDNGVRFNHSLDWLLSNFLEVIIQHRLWSEWGIIHCKCNECNIIILNEDNDLLWSTTFFTWIKTTEKRVFLGYKEK